MIQILSYLLVWVEHNSDLSSHVSSADVLSEGASNSTGVTVGGDDLTPANSESSFIRSVLDLVDMCNSFTHVPSGTGLIIAVLNVNESLIHDLSDSVSSEACEDTLLIKSDWLSLVVLLPVLCFCLSFSHSSLFVIKIIQYISSF